MDADRQEAAGEEDELSENDGSVVVPLRRFSFCPCGHPALNESIQVGARYRIWPESKRKGVMAVMCGGCKIVYRGYEWVLANQLLNPDREPAWLPAILFEEVGAPR